MESCGDGTDAVYFDEGLDEIDLARKTCENLVPEWKAKASGGARGDGGKAHLDQGKIVHSYDAPGGQCLLGYSRCVTRRG